MSRKLAFTPRARGDVESVYRRYESQRVGLGSEFEEELAHALSLLRSMPEAGPVVHRNLRRLLVQRFRTPSTIGSGRPRLKFAVVSINAATRAIGLVAHEA